MMKATRLALALTLALGLHVALVAAKSPQQAATEPTRRRVE